MAFSELYVCDRCGTDAVLVHAEEWAPVADSHGGTPDEPLPYPGSGPIGGLLNRLWCPGCRAVRAYRFLTLNPPGDHAVVAYAEAQRVGCDGTESGPCPVCQTPLTWEAGGQACPDCPDGILRFTGEWEDAV